MSKTETDSQEKMFKSEHLIPDTEHELEIPLLSQANAAEDGVRSVKSPVRALLDGAGDLVKGFAGLPRNKKALILTAVLALLWIVLGHLLLKGKTGSVTELLSWLTYARGGLTGGASGLIGGCLGKAVVGAGFYTLLSGGGSQIAGGIKKLFSKKSLNPGSLLTGFGLAGLVYAFTAGAAGRGGSMVGILGALLALRASAAKTGFFSSFAASLSAKKGEGGVRAVVPARFQGILTGAAAGFALFALLAGAFALHITGVVWYIVLLAAVVAGIVLTYTGTKNAMRMLSFIAAVSFAAAHLFLFGAPVRAEESGYWKFVDQRDESFIAPQDVQFKDVSGSAAGGFHVRREVIEHNHRAYLDYPGQKGHEDCFGEFGEETITFSPLPGSKLIPGETLSVNASVSCQTSGHALEPGGRATIRMHWDLNANRFAYLENEDIESDQRPSILENIELLPRDCGGYIQIVGDYSGTYSAEIPEGNTGSRSKLYIVFSFCALNSHIDSIYEYEWVDTTETEPAAAVTETTTGTTTSTTTTIIQTVNQDAKEEAGLDGGAGIITEIITGVAGAVIGGAAIGAAASGKSGGDDRKKKKSAYKMVIYKDFGDGIRRCAAPVRVYAAIVEITGGEEINRPQLSEKITVSSGDMVARDGGIENTYRCAEVSVPQNYRNETGTLTFTYAGEGGIFRNNIKFRIVDEPKILFDARESEDGTSWVGADYSVTLPVIAGMGGSDSLRFVISDATEEPKEIRFSKHEGLTVTCQKDPQLAFTYYACVENHTGPIEKVNGIFAAGQTVKVTVEAEFADGMVISNIFSVALTPDGLSVLAADADMQNGRLLINTDRDSDRRDGRGQATIPPTSFSVTVAYPDSEGRAVVLEQPAVSFAEKLNDDGRYGYLFTDNFGFETRNRGSSGYALYPQTTVPLIMEPYEVSLHMTAEAEDGQTFEADLPLAVTGVAPDMLPSKIAQEDAIRRLKKAIKVFGVSDSMAVIVRNPEQYSAADLEVIRQNLIIAAVKFEQESKEATERMDQLLTDYIVVAGSLVKCGDKAVEVLLSKMLPVGGDVAAAIINPLKNLMATYLGEYAASGNLDNAPDFHTTVLSACQDYTEGIITGKEKPSAKALGYIVAAYLMLSFIKHYTAKDDPAKGDIYRSLIAACRDLTIAKFREWFLSWIASAGEKIFEAIGKFCGNVFKYMANDRIKEAVKLAGDKAFADSMRNAAKNGITRDALNAARWAKESASQNEGFLQNVLMSQSAKDVGLFVTEGIDSMLGTILNYLAGGKIEKGSENEALGRKAEEVVQGYAEDRLRAYFEKKVGVKVETVIDKAISRSMLSFRIEGGEKLILCMLGFEVSVPIRENLPVLFDIAYSFCTAWMDVIWEKLKSGWDPGTVPDPRDTLEKSTEIIERQMQRVEDLKPIECRFAADEAPAT